MPFIEDKTKEIIDEVTRLLVEIPGEHLEGVISDVVSFLKQNKTEINRWVESYRAGELSRADLTWLLKSKRDLVVLKTLEHLGIGAVKLEEYRDRVIEAVKKVALGGLLTMIKRLLGL